MQKDNLEDSMISEANLILTSIDWIEKQIDEKLISFETALEQEDIRKGDYLKKEINVLLKKLKQEEKNMSIFMDKYTKAIHEEKKILSDIKQRIKT